MSDPYTKLFASITESTVWREPAGTRLVWITMLARSSRKGEVYASVPGLADLAKVTLDECVIALKTLQSPDPWSRTPDFEGRRIEPIAGGWRLLNYAKFDQMRSEAEAAERRAEAKREWDRQNRPSGYRRQSDKSPSKVRQSPTRSDTVRQSPSQSVPPVDQKQELKQEQEQKQQDGRRGARLPDVWQPSEAVRAWAQSEYPTVNLEAALAEFIDFWRAVPGQKGRKLDWDATFRNRVRELAERQTQRRNGDAAHRESVADRAARLCREGDERERLAGTLD